MSTESTETDRATLLGQINAQLAERNLKPLTALGDHSHGQIELRGVEAVYDHSARFFTDVQFRCTFPGGATGLYTIRWNANSAVSDGAVMIVTINGRVAMVRQYRPAHGQWFTELPRGFGESLDNAKVNGGLGTLKVADLPVATALRELGEEVIEAAEVVSVQHLGNIAQDSSTHTAAPAYWAIEINVDPAALEKRLASYSEEGLALKLWSVDQIKRAIGTKLQDSHTLTGVLLWFSYLERMEQMANMA